MDRARCVGLRIIAFGLRTSCCFRLSTITAFGEPWADWSFMRPAKSQTKLPIWILDRCGTRSDSGLSFWAGNKSWFKIYVGFGSREGVHPYRGIPKF